MDPAQLFNEPDDKHAPSGNDVNTDKEATESVDPFPLTCLLALLNSLKILTSQTSAL
jgi:hypothetical protein